MELNILSSRNTSKCFTEIAHEMLHYIASLFLRTHFLKGMVICIQTYLFLSEMSHENLCCTKIDFSIFPQNLDLTSTS